MGDGEQQAGELRARTLGHGTPLLCCATSWNDRRAGPCPSPQAVPLAFSPTFISWRLPQHTYFMVPWAIMRGFCGGQERAGENCHWSKRLARGAEQQGRGGQRAAAGLEAAGMRRAARAGPVRRRALAELEPTLLCSMQPATPEWCRDTTSHSSHLKACAFLLRSQLIWGRTME